MKKLISALVIITVMLMCSACSNLSFSDMVSDFYEILPQTQEVIEVKYEQFYIENPQYSRCYNALNSKQKDYYSRICAISEEMTEGFVDVGENYTNAMPDFSVAYNAFFNDKAEVFWMPNSYILALSGREDSRRLAVAFSYSDEGRKNRYTVTKTERDNCKSELDAVVDSIMTEINGMSEYEKELYINDYICDNVTYKEEGKFVNTSYGALVGKEALCEGYSRAFKLLCNKAGIECDLIIGKSDGVGHMWNRVNIDLKHSYVDVTWNDREHKTYAYFNVTDEQLKKTHSFAPVLSELDYAQLENKGQYNFTQKECSFTGNSYYEKNSLMLWSVDKANAAKAVEMAARNVENQAEFMFATPEAQQLFESDEIAYITEIQEKVKTAVINGYAVERDVLILFF